MSRKILRITSTLRRTEGAKKVQITDNTVILYANEGPESYPHFNHLCGRVMEEARKENPSAMMVTLENRWLFGWGVTITTG